MCCGSNPLNCGKSGQDNKEVGVRPLQIKNGAWMVSEKKTIQRCFLTNKYVFCF